MRLPEKINAKWIDALSNEQIVDAESQLRRAFARVEKAEKKQRGEAYALMRGSEELMLAWDRWTRVNGATRARGLHPARQ